MVSARTRISTGKRLTMSEDLYWRLHGLSKALEGSGLIDESQHPDAYSTILDAMAFVRGHPAENLYDTQAQAGAVPPTYQHVIASWNAKADEHNQWDALGEDEKIEWAVACAKAAPQAVVEPLTDEQIQEAILPINPHGMGYFLRIASAIERAHGIGIKGGQHGAE